MEELLYAIGISAVAVSAMTGVLEAGRKPIDLFGVVLVALTSALGGGTMRDLLLDRRVFWLEDPTYLFSAIGAGLATVALVRMVRLPKNLFLVPDALGLALFTVLGTHIALVLDVHWFAATLLGVVTGVVGGVLRDMLCNEVPLVFSGELYGTAAWSGALVYAALLRTGVADSGAALAATIVVFGMRMAAVHWRITLPTFVAR